MPLFRIFATFGRIYMKKVIITYGLISGVIIAALVWVTTSLCEMDVISLDYGMFIGYASMLIALTMVFFGIKSYRDNYSGGRITFWKAVQIGFLISLIAATMYFLGAVSYYLAFPGFDERFLAKFTVHMVGKLQASGASQAEIDEVYKTVEMMRGLFKNPLTFYLVALMEFLPVGIIVTLISSALLRKKEVLPA